MRQHLIFERISPWRRLLEILFPHLRAERERDLRACLGWLVECPQDPVSYREDSRAGA